jgi:hypothetical protein
MAEQTFLSRRELSMQLVACRPRLTAWQKVVVIAKPHRNFEIRTRLANEAPQRVGASDRLIVWYRDCSHQVEPDPAEMATRYGAKTPMPD